MNPTEYGRMYELEDHYWWFVGRRNLALRLLRKFLPSGSPKILDLGCGTGVVSRELASRGEVVSLDMSEIALRFCAERGIGRRVLGNGEKLPLKSDTFDAIVALDIFEHIADDGAAFAEARRVLKPGGILILSVPAFRSLWGPHDVALMHHRRYRLGEVRRKLLTAGLVPRRLSHSVFFLFPAVVTLRFFEKRKKGPAKAQLVPVTPAANRALIGLQHLEAGLIERLRLPWGSSIVAVAKKPEEPS